MESTQIHTKTFNTHSWGIPDMQLAFLIQPHHIRTAIWINSCTIRSFWISSLPRYPLEGSGHFVHNTHIVGCEEIFFCFFRKKSQHGKNLITHQIRHDCILEGISQLLKSIKMNTLISYILEYLTRWYPNFIYTGIFNKVNTLISYILESPD